MEVDVFFKPGKLVIAMCMASVVPLPLFVLYLVVNHTRNASRDLTHAREILGQSFHTLQDFYSHSNWVEMGRTDVNELIGFNETIGAVAAPNQATCTSDGCTKIVKACVILLSPSVVACHFSVFSSDSLAASQFGYLPASLL